MVCSQLSPHFLGHSATYNLNKKSVTDGPDLTLVTEKSETRKRFLLCLSLRVHAVGTVGTVGTFSGLEK